MPSSNGSLSSTPEELPEKKLPEENLPKEKAEETDDKRGGDNIVVRPHNWLVQKVLGAQPRPVPPERQPCPKSWKNPLDFVTWGWMYRTLRTGFDRILEINDAYLIPPKEANERRLKDYHFRLEQMTTRTANGDAERTPYAEFWAMLYALRWYFTVAMITASFFSAGEIGQSLMSRSVIEVIDEIYLGQTTSHGHAVAWVFGQTLVQFGFIVALLWFQFQGRYFAELCRTILITAVYDKVTKLSPRGRQLYPASKITAVITTDTNRIYMAARWTSMLLIFGPGFGGMLAVLVHNLGVSALPGCGLVLVGISINVGLSRIITKLRRRSLPFADERIAAVRETVENMRIIKFYGWESSFVDLISRARARESTYLKKLGLFEGFTDAFLTSIPMFGGILAFSVRIILGHGLNPALAFPSLTLFQLFVPLSMMFSAALTSHADAWTSIVRLNEFFRAPEEPTYVQKDAAPGTVTIDGDAAFKWDVALPTPAQKTQWRRRLRLYRRKERADEVDIETAEAPGGAAMRPTGSARNDYEEENDEKREELDKLQRAGAQKFPGLHDINLSMRQGELIMVCGSIGSGKTTLLSVIVGIVSKLKGNVHVGGSVASVMSMWSRNATIRDNILFGSDFDPKWYDRVVHACSLDSDFESFSGRDFAEVGERGITLSGGQKARIALARCVYTRSDIVLLDDVLSAVDGKVGNHIFRHCINGVLANTTRVMVTHNLKLLAEADRLVYMPGDGSAVVGTLNELMASNPGFVRMYREGINATNDDANSETQALRQRELEEEREEKLAKIEDEDSALSSSSSYEDTKHLDDGLEIKRQLSRAPVATGMQLVHAENRERGTLKGQIMTSYLRSGSQIGMAFVLIIVVAAMCVAVGQTMLSVWLQFWTGDRYHERSGWYIGFYALIITLRASAFLTLAICVCTFCFNSSSKLHNDAVHAIYRAPISYFDSTPLGRIINRFTDDIANLDTQLFMMLRMTLFMTSMLLASMVTVFVYAPYTALVLIPVLSAAFVLFNYYRASSRELKRINSGFRSMMFTLVTETISGLSVILSYGRQGDFAQDLNRRIDDMNITFQMNLACQLWLSFRIAMTSLMVTFVVLMLAAFQVFNLDASKVGLLLSLLPSVAMTMVNLLPQLAEVENQMNSVERLYELAYTLPQEAPATIEETAPPPSWPQEGRIRFEQVCLRYRAELPLVLDHINLDIKGGEKIGICGRTGAGKSTILSALFRITELSSGRIVIDGVDIATIGLHDLRTKLSIIPQDPVLFQGTIRSNLDPFNQHSDAELWSALRRAGVVRENEISKSNAVSTEHKFHLDSKIDGEGANFSLGERQLLTMARALVRNSRIIVLDEATATVDFETDKMIQRTIVREFAHCTILCIAHRLQTILHYDQVVVMDKGKIAEMGEPRALFDDASSRFGSMCRDSNVSESDFGLLQD